MIPQSVNYIRAKSVADAIGLLKKHEGAKILAGGHSLIPSMKLRLNSPSILVDISHIAEIKGITQDGNNIIIGAGVTHGEIAKSPLIQKHFPVLVQTAEVIGDTQIRNFGTIGGSLAHADPAADWPAALLVCDAKILVKAPGKNKVIEAAKFSTGFFSTALDENSVITGIRIAIPKSGTRSGYEKFMQPASRFAIVGCAVSLTMDADKVADARVAFTGVSGAPYRNRTMERMLKGKTLDAALVEKVSKKATSGIDDVMSDHFASEEYRTHLATVYAKRVLTSLTSNG